MRIANKIASFTHVASSNEGNPQLRVAFEEKVAKSRQKQTTGEQSNTRDISNL